MPDNTYDNAASPRAANDIYSEYVANATYEVIEPPKKDFKGWHLPRKQFVREEQWLKQVSKLFEEFPSTQDSLRYLGLPGNDLLDLRFFREHFCLPRKMRLQFLGFNRMASSPGPDQIELNVAKEDLIKLPNVDPLSDVLGFDICSIGKKGSLAYDAAELHGPFDVINLDLCDGFAKHDVNLNFGETHYSALDRILALQTASKRPWLLFLSTRVGNQHVAQEVFKRLCAIYSQNLAGEAFKQASQDAFSIQNSADLVLASNDHDGHTNIFLTGLCKWMTQRALALNPAVKFELKSCLAYCVEKSAGKQDFISMAIRFEPTKEPAADPAGLSAAEGSGLEEQVIAIRSLKRLAKRRDVDKYLVDDPKLDKELENNMASMLAAARFDVSRYPAWVADQKQLP